MNTFCESLSVGVESCRNLRKKKEEKGNTQLIPIRCLRFRSIGNLHEITNLKTCYVFIHGRVISFKLFKVEGHKPY